jgi:phosphoribosylglycinamide formyltransferase-1
VVLVSGAGTNLQALLDACADGSYGAAVVAVGADRGGIQGLARAERAGVPVFTHRVADHPSRAAWDRALTRSCARHQPDLVISAGFMKLVGKDFLDRFGGRFVNTHPSLLPAFAGMHAVRDALGYGVKVTGCTVFLVDAGTDTGPVIAQAAVGVREDDDEASLHERIKVTERALLVETVGRMVRDGWSVQGRTVLVGRQEAGAARQDGRG